MASTLNAPKAAIRGGAQGFRTFEPDSVSKRKEKGKEKRNEKKNMEKIRKRIVFIGLCGDTSAKLRASSLIGFDQATLKGCKTPLNKPLAAIIAKRHNREIQSSALLFARTSLEISFSPLFFCSPTLLIQSLFVS